MSKIELISEVTGSVWKIQTKPKARVKEGDTVVIIESMKMEIPVIATESGSVAEIHLEEGDTVNEGDVVVTIET